jgi:hypothetical protein
MDLDTLLERHRTCCITIRNLPPSQLHRDCVKMARATENAISDVSRAQVDCQRLGKSTPVYQEALDRAEESVHNLERYVMMAQLMI